MITEVTDATAATAERKRLAIVNFRVSYLRSSSSTYGGTYSPLANFGGSIIKSPPNKIIPQGGRAMKEQKKTPAFRRANGENPHKNNQYHYNREKEKRQ